jgi:hypothetical protein
MLLFYIDESGHHRMDADRDDPTRLARDTTEWFVLSAVGIRDTSRRPLAEEVDRIKRDHLRPDKSGSWNETEIKGRRLAITWDNVRDGDDRPDGYRLASAEKVEALEKDLRLLFSRFRPITVTVAIDKHRLFATRPGEPALGWAYAFLYRRLALLLARIYPGEGGVLVADQQTEHEKAFRDHELTRIRDELARGRLTADYRLLLDRPLWIDSSLSTWDREIIQLADLVAFTTHMGVESGFETQTLWPAIYPTLARGWSDGEPDGEGLVIYPNPAAWPLTAP